MTNVFVKDPDAVLDYQWDWSEWLAGGETITDATITVPEGLTLDNQVNTNTTVTAWLSGGTDGDGYKLTCHIVTTAGREDDRNIYINCRSR